MLASRDSSDHQHTVLMINDNADLTEVLGTFLEMKGYAAVAAFDGREALQLLQNGVRPCLILLDLMMPGMSGDEFIEVLHRNHSYRDIPVLVLSAAYDARERATRLGAVGAVRLPGDLDAVVEVVQRHCGEPQ